MKKKVLLTVSARHFCHYWCILLLPSSCSCLLQFFSPCYVSSAAHDNRRVPSASPVSTTGTELKVQLLELRNPTVFSSFTSANHVCCMLILLCSFIASLVNIHHHLQIVRLCHLTLNKPSVVDSWYIVIHFLDRRSQLTGVRNIPSGKKSRNLLTSKTVEPTLTASIQHFSCF